MEGEEGQDGGRGAISMGRRWDLGVWSSREEQKLPDELHKGARKNPAG